MNKRPSRGKTALLTELETLSSRMMKVAGYMLEHGGEIHLHGKELEGAAKIAKEWVAGIREEMLKK